MLARDSDSRSLEIVEAEAAFDLLKQGLCLFVENEEFLETH